jgi:hypothetical protein
MMDALEKLLTDLFNWRRDTALSFAEWLAHLIGEAIRPPTPVYLPRHSMTPEEIERVRWRAEQPPTD